MTFEAVFCRELLHVQLEGLLRRGLHRCEFLVFLGGQARQAEEGDNNDHQGIQVDGMVCFGFELQNRNKV